jgi:dipeptide/tripeptide permease
VLIAFSVKGMGMEDKISMFFLIGMYFLHTCVELAISPVGLSVVNKLSPKRFASMMMAVFFLSSVVGNFTAGLFSGLIPQPEVKEVIVNQAANAKLPAGTFDMQSPKSIEEVQKVVTDASR